jgi:hypothetical protein
VLCHTFGTTLYGLAVPWLQLGMQAGGQACSGGFSARGDHKAGSGSIPHPMLRQTERMEATQTAVGKVS